MKISNIKYYSTVNGTGVRTAVFVSGCSLHCDGCFNKEAQDFNYGKELNKDIINKILNSIDKPYIQGLSILGGEPMDKRNQEGVANIIKKFKKKFGNTKNIWLYTGYKFDNIPITKYKDYILSNINVIVDGPFIKELAIPNLEYRGSTNQNIIIK